VIEINIFKINTNVYAMPHIIIEGKTINFESIHNHFTKTAKRDNEYIIKLEDSFINQSNDLMLIRTTVIENNINQKYYIQLMKKDNQVTVRLDPTTDPSDKNNGVKLSIAMVAKLILSIHKEPDDLKITKTNLAGFI
jgi:hypothetical protein